MNLKTLLTGVVAAVLGGSLGAMPYVADNPSDILFDAAHPFYSGTFDITAVGYNPLTEQVTDGSAMFLFQPPGDSGSLGIGVGLSLLDLMVDPTIHFTESGPDGFVGAISIGMPGRVLDLSADGIISYSITRESGEFWLSDAKLEAYAEARVADAVPSAALFAAGFIALQLFRRRAVA